MGEVNRKLINAKRRSTRTRSTLHGTTERPRLSVHVSNKHISAQIINDDSHETIVSATTVGSKSKGTMTELAAIIGTDIAKKAKAKKIKTVMFDRGNKQYHGRVKALADAARAEGLEF